MISSSYQTRKNIAQKGKDEKNQYTFAISITTNNTNNKYRII